MMDDEIVEFLKRHLDAILENNLEIYHETTHPDLTLYEWWVTPHRLDGLPFHDFMISENARRGAVFGQETQESSGWTTRGERTKEHTRMDLANLRVQRYGDTAIASYTLLISTGGAGGVTVAAHNESRVMVRLDGRWQVVHVHKSPAWQAPHVPPGV
jgi:hypothetical protein